MQASSEMHTPREPFDPFPGIVERLTGVRAQGRLPPAGGNVSLADSLQNRGYIRLRVHKCSPKADKSRIMGVASSDTGFAEPPGDFGRFTVRGTKDIPAVE